MRLKIFTQFFTLLAGFMMLANVNVAMAQTVNMERWIELTVEKDANIKFILAGDTDNTAVKIESGSTNDTIIVAASWGESPTALNFIAGATTMKIYGNVKALACGANYENITGINVLNNTGLVELYCSSNNISSLDLTGLTKLQKLYCGNNNLTSLKISGLTALSELYCNVNKLTSLNLTGCTALQELQCSDNQLNSLKFTECTALQKLTFQNNNLTTLDLSSCVNLERIGGYNNALTTINVKGLEKLYFLSVALNKLTSLDISGCYALTQLSIRNNNFSTPEIEKIYCSLPQREVAEEAYIIVLENESDPNKPTVLATTKRNATDKNWNVCYSGDAKTPIDETSGSYTCPLLEYPLWVAGIQVTELNEQNILGDSTVSYNPGSNTLTLNNAKITDAMFSAGSYIYFVGIETTIENLNIHLIGENVIDIYVDNDPTESYQGNGIYTNKNLKFYGKGTLHIKRVSALSHEQTVFTGLYAAGIEIDQATVIIEGVDNSILISDNQKDLTLSNSATIDCRAKMVLPKQPVVYAGAIMKEGDTAEGLNVVEQFALAPFGELFSTKRYVKIEPIIIHYDGDNVQGIGVSSGATFTVAIRLTNDELESYYNSHKITQVRYYIYGTEATSTTIKIYGNGTAIAPGELLVDELTSPPQEGWNIHTLSTPLLITSGDYWVGYEVVATGGWPAGVDAGPAIAGKGDWIYSEELTEEWLNISDLGLDYNWNIRAVLTPLTVTNYGIEIAGTELTSDNVEKINEFPYLELTEGAITYDHSEKTFTLTNVTANVTSDGNFIWIKSSAEEADYTINLVGNNVVTSEGASITSLYRNFIVTGDGSLKVTSADNCGFYVKESTLTIKNTTVEAIGKWGIAGRDGSSNEHLIIEKSNVTATGTSGSICDFQSITLTNCEITQPIGAINNGHAVTLGGSVVTSEVKISPTTGLSTLAAEGIYVWGERGAISIEIPGSASGRTAHIYNVSGMLVRTLPLQGTEGQVAVPAGIYIVRIGNAIEKVVVR